MPKNKHYCKLFTIVKDEGFAEILQCECGRKYRKFWNENLTQIHILNEEYIHDKELGYYNELIIKKV